MLNWLVSSRRFVTRKTVINFILKSTFYTPDRFACVVVRTGFTDYERERRTWNVTIPKYFNFASDVLDVWANKEKTGERDPSVPAFWYVYENGKQIKWTFQELQNETKRYANTLEKHFGIRRGDHVFTLLPKLPEFYLIVIAAVRIGFVICPGTVMMTERDIAYRVDALRPSCIIAHEKLTDAVDNASKHSSFVKTKIVVSSNHEFKKSDWLNFNSKLQHFNSNHKCAPTSRDDTMMIYFTSGTTGNPKMVEHTHTSYGLCLASFGSFRYTLDLTSRNVYWNASDTGWVLSAFSMLGPWHQGACMFVHEMPRFVPEYYLNVLSKYPIDTITLPPTAYGMLIHEDAKKYSFPKLEHCTSGGEPLNLEISKKWESMTGLKIYQAYGQTETIVLMETYKCLDFKLGAIGKASPGMDVVILDEDFKEVGPGTVGEIGVKLQGNYTYGIFKGYKNDPEKTAAQMKNGYYLTGDQAYVDEDGYFWFVSRKDDVIISAGYRIGPYEVESALMEHPAVVEVAVTSSPDPERGEMSGNFRFKVVKAFVVLRPDYAGVVESKLIKELQEHTKRITAPYKYPRKIEFVTELPKTISGKIKRQELKKNEFQKN